MSITISRDEPMPGETLEAYVDRQVQMLTSKMRSYTLLGKQPPSLSKALPIDGVEVDGDYLHEGRPYYQRQAAFLIAPCQALVFSTTSQAKFTPQQTENWQEMLASFTPHHSAAAQE